jgi:hypothetical protein
MVLPIHPVTRTSPSVSSVAVCEARAALMSAVAVKVSLEGSKRSAADSAGILRKFSNPPATSIRFRS